MQCPSCSSQLVAGEARCGVCQALVNPPVAGASALAPRLVTPQSLDGLRGPVEPEVTPSPAVFADFVTPAAKDDPGKSENEAWRREVLERVRKRRQARRHALPLFSEGPGAPDAPASAAVQDEPAAGFETAPPDVPGTSGSAFDGPLAASPAATSTNDLIFDLPMRPAEGEAARPRAFDGPMQSYVDRPRPTLVGGPITTRSLVGDLPFVEPSTPAEPESITPPRLEPSGPRPAMMADRIQAALIDLGVWSAMNATAFYFASRIGRTSILGLGSAWQGLALFALVIASAYILFFGGLIGATPGKMACGIRVLRADGTPLGPLPSLARGFLGLGGIVLFGIGVWPAFWDSQHRTLHDRATDSRVTTV